ncbi:MAG: 4-(cytidine 5'-diphospho)-2-C-methyl-D-erythritol kinase [Bacteroidales bacterium]
MISFPNAKINLGLYVVAKRTDGYHNIESVLWPVPWNDVLEIVRSPNGQFEMGVSGISLDVSREENLVFQAWRLMQDHFSLPAVHIHLHKNIPMGAGLGGGSSDAAFTIKMLNQLFALNLSKRKMQSLARKIGSDCIFFIDNIPRFVAGTGELLSETKADPGGYHIGIIKPSAHISTAEAYQNIMARPAPRGWEKRIRDPRLWKEHIHNQFEEYVMAQYPSLLDVKERMYAYGAIYASLTGSGSAIYGLFNEKPDMAKWFPEFLNWQGRL